MPQVGEKAPDFALEDDQGQTFRLSDFRGERLLLVFYPGDDTPVCTRQLCDYRDGIESFRGLDVKIVGISKDDQASHQAFKAKHELPFTLLSDPDQSVAKQYDADGWLTTKRAVFLVDEVGTVRYAHVEAVSLFRRRREELLSVIQGLDRE